MGAAAGVGAAVGVGAPAGVEATAVAGDVLSAGCDETARPFGATIDDPAPPLLHAATAKSSAGAANVRSAALHKRFIRNFLSAGVPKRESLSRGWESFPPAVRKDRRNKMGEREPHHIARCRPQPPSPRARCLNHPRDNFLSQHVARHADRHAQQNLGHAFAERVVAERSHAAPAERALADEVERIDAGQAVARHRAFDEVR